jgi:hypothetical protein
MYAAVAAIELTKKKARTSQMESGKMGLPCDIVVMTLPKMEILGKTVVQCGSCGPRVMIRPVTIVSRVLLVIDTIVAKCDENHPQSLERKQRLIRHRPQPRVVVFGLGLAVMRFEWITKGCNLPTLILMRIRLPLIPPPWT